MLMLFSLGCMTLDASSSVNFSSLVSDECRGVNPGSGRILLCETYCKVLKCDALPENPIGILGKLRAKACDSAFQKWSKVAPGEILPCLTQPSIALEKKVLNAVDGKLNEGDQVIYQFTITNNGNTPLQNIELIDTQLISQYPNELDSCLSLLSGKVLANGEVFECSSAGSFTAVEGVDVENTATVSAVSSVGSQVVTANALAAYFVIPQEPAVCPTPLVDELNVYVNSSARAAQAYILENGLPIACSPTVPGTDIDFDRDLLIDPLENFLFSSTGVAIDLSVKVTCISSGESYTIPSSELELGIPNFYPYDLSELEVEACTLLYE